MRDIWQKTLLHTYVKASSKHICTDWSNNRLYSWLGEVQIQFYPTSGCSLLRVLQRGLVPPNAGTSHV